MSPSPSHRRAATLPTSEALLQEALLSQDAFRISELVKALESSGAPGHAIEKSLNDIARAHPEKTPIVIRCLSALERMKSEELRPLCRLIVNAPLDPDRDLIVGHAAFLLAQHHDPEQVDVLLLARAIDHRSEHVKLSARRALSHLTQTVADQLYVRASELPEKPQLAMLKRLVRGEDPLSTLRFPTPPRPAKTEESPRPLPISPLRAKGKSKGALRETPVVFTTPVADAVAGKGAKRQHEIKAEEPQPAPQTEPAASMESTLPLDITLEPHRIPGYHLLSDSALSHIVTLSKNYREVAAALAEYTIRRGHEKARDFSSRLVYALTDPSNIEKWRFEDIAGVWYSDPR